MANGPIADKRPSTIAFLAKLDDVELEDIA